MAKKIGGTLETVRPILDRALSDPSFRKDLKDALEAARELYGPLAKSDGVKGSAKALVTDKKVQEQVRKALEDLQSATGKIAGKKATKGSKGRNTVLLAGVIAGALYNPWTGSKTRDWLTAIIAGDDDLQPLEDLERAPEPVGAGAATNGAND
ncbi:MAG: hypothetical protein ACKVUT_11700 [Gaiella sp.]